MINNDYYFSLGILGRIKAIQLVFDSCPIPEDVIKYHQEVFKPKMPDVVLLVRTSKNKNIEKIESKIESAAREFQKKVSDLIPFEKRKNVNASLRILEYEISLFFNWL